MTSKIPCSKKGCTKFEDEFHHIVPHFMGGKDIDGRTFTLYRSLKSGLYDIQIKAEVK